MLAAYAEQHDGTRPSGSAESELRDDLVALLEMISSMVVKDGLDWGDGSTGEVGAAAGHGGSAAQQVHVIDVALYGLTMVCVVYLSPASLPSPLSPHSLCAVLHACMCVCACVCVIVCGCICMGVNVFTFF